MGREFEPGMNPPSYEGNPHFTGEGNEEAFELGKAQLKSKLDSALSELESAKARMDQLAEDETIDPEAAQNLLNMRQAEFNALEQEWNQQYGPETTH